MEAAHYKVMADYVLREIRENSKNKPAKQNNHSRSHISGVPKR